MATTAGATFTTHTTVPPSSPIISPTTNIYVGNGEIENMTDTVTPQFEVMRGKGHIINNGMASTKYELQLPGSPYQITQQAVYIPTNVVSNSTTYTRNHQPSVIPWATGDFRFLHQMSASEFTSHVSSLPMPAGLLTKDQLVVKALAKASETDVLALVSLAEARKTLDGLLKAALSFQRIKEYVARSGPKLFSPGGILKLTGDGLRVWLEVRYGILPTYYDVLGYYNQAITVGSKSRVRFHAASQGGILAYAKTVEDSDNYRKVTRIISRYRNIRRTAGCLVEPYAENVGPIHSLGVDRLGSSAWELIPFSFIADWFLNASQVIAAHEGRFGQRVLASWFTQEDSIATSYTRLARGHTKTVHPYRYTGIMTNDGYGFENCVRKLREANPSVPLLPSLKLRLNWYKVTDLTAILSGLVLSLRQGWATSTVRRKS